MASRVYPVFLPAANGPDLVVKRGGVVISTIAPGLDIKRTARLTVPMLDFDSGCEFFVYGKAGTVIANKVSVGMVTEDADLNDYVGSDKYGVGYRLAEGHIHHDGASTDSVSSSTLGTAIGIFFQPDAQQVTFLKNGEPLITKALPADMQGVPLYLAVSLGSDVEPGDIEVQANPGRYWYEYPVGAEWWEVAPMPTTLRISDEPFISPGTDVPAYVRWEGGITADRIQDDRGVHFWLWGRGDQARGSAAILDVLDSTGYLDQTLGGVFRDQPASLQLASVDIATAQSLGNYIVDKIESAGPLKRRITLKGPLAQFEVPMLNRQVRPDSDEDSVGQFYPMLIGPAFSCPLRLLTKADRMYAVDALGAEAVGKVRDNGAALDPSSQFTVHAGGQRIEVLNEPAGTITLDAAASGGTYTPPATPDVVDGDGSPFTGTTLPDNWTVLANPAGDNFQITTGRLTLPVPGASGYVPYGAIKHDTAQLIAGRTYKYSITFNNINQRSPTASKVGLAKGFGANGPVPWLQATGPIIGSRWHDVDGIQYSSFPTTVTGTYTPAVTHDVILYWVDWTAPDGFSMTGTVSNIVLYELAPPEYLLALIYYFARPYKII